MKPLEDRMLRHQKEEQIVIEAMKNLGGIVRVPVMVFRKYLAEPMRETHIKHCLKRLIDQGKVVQSGERCDCRGHIYKLVSK